MRSTIGANTLPMKKREFWLAMTWLALIVVGSCARRGIPTGGEKDTIPPRLIGVTPPLETVNFDGDEIVLEFDELIEARNLKSELIVTPPIDDYDFYIKKNALYIQLKEDLLDSTTYTFNFGQTIQDLSERNKAENAVVAFSTGSYIDSFQVSGSVRKLLTQQPVEGAIIALYNIKDTLDAFTGPPVYFAKADEEGNYTIRYIKKGEYQAYAYADANSNLKAETNKEAYGFLADPLRLGVTPNATDSSDSSPVSALKAIDINIFRKDIQPLVLQSSRSNGKYYEIKFNKGIRNYSLRADREDVTSATKSFVEALNVNSTDSSRYLFYNLQGERKFIRVYNTLQQDSLRIILNATDSIEQAITDSVIYLQFVESRRKAEEFKTEFKAKSNAIEQGIESSIQFNKPVTSVQTDSILLGYDTLFYIPIDYKNALLWNEELDNVRIKIPVDRRQLIDSVLFYQRIKDSVSFIRQQDAANNYLDSLRRKNNVEKQRQLLKALARTYRNAALDKLLDSVNATRNDEQVVQLIQTFADTVQLSMTAPIKQYDRETVDDNLKALNFYVAPGSFISVEQDSNQAIIQRYTFKNPEKYGTVSGTVEVPYENYFLQLIDKKYQVVEELRNPKKYTFRMIPPDTYRLRILVDTDNDGRWEDGNILLNQEPEPVLIYQQEVVFRENWEVNDVDINADKLSTLSSE